jgi:hypothetical protein
MTQGSQVREGYLPLHDNALFIEPSRAENLEAAEYDLGPMDFLLQSTSGPDIIILFTANSRNNGILAASPADSFGKPCDPGRVLKILSGGKP